MYFLHRFLCMKMWGTKGGIFVWEWGNVSLSEHDFKDLKDVQDGVASCTSFHPQNRVQDERKGVQGASRKGFFFFAALRLCEQKNNRTS